MSIKEIKKFAKEHKGAIIGGIIGFTGTAALAVIGTKCRKPKLTDASDLLDDPYFLDLLNTLGRISKQCTHYTETSSKAIWSMFDKDGNLIDPCIKCSDGRILCVNNIIAFGHEVKSKP